MSFLFECLILVCALVGSWHITGWVLNLAESTHGKVIERSAQILAGRKEGSDV